MTLRVRCSRSSGPSRLCWMDLRGKAEFRRFRSHANSAPRSRRSELPFDGEEAGCLFFPTLSQKFRPAHGSRKPAGRIFRRWRGEWRNPRVGKWRQKWLLSKHLELQISKNNVTRTAWERKGCRATVAAAKVPGTSAIPVRSGTSGSSLPASPHC